MVRSRSKFGIGSTRTLPVCSRAAPRAMAALRWVVGSGRSAADCFIGILGDGEAWRSRPAWVQPAGRVSAFAAVSCAALPTASAVMLTTRRTVAEGVRMCAGRAAPSRIGPTVTPWPPVIFSTLKRMLAASRFGQISRLASPLQRAVRQVAAGAPSPTARRRRASRRRTRCRAPAARKQLARRAHLARRAALGRAEVGVRQERDLGRQAEAAHLVGGHQRDVGQLLGARVLVDVGVGDEQRALRRASARSASAKPGAPARQADDVAHVLEVAVEAADQPAQHRVGIAQVHHQRGDQWCWSGAPPPSPPRA